MAIAARENFGHAAALPRLHVEQGLADLAPEPGGVHGAVPATRCNPPGPEAHRESTAATL